MILTFICTSTTGSATKLEALEYQLGSSSYPKGNIKKINYPSFYTTLQENAPKNLNCMDLQYFHKETHSFCGRRVSKPAPAA